MRPVSVAIVAQYKNTSAAQAGLVAASIATPPGGAHNSRKNDYDDPGATMRRLSMISILLAVAVPVVAQAVPSPVSEDPPVDSEHPARLEAVHIPSHGVKFNGAIYVAAGPGPHPTAILLKGMPGIEQNLDVGQAIRRAGWNALTMHARGSWGSPGRYSYQHLIEDAAAAVAFVREPANVAALSIDAQRVVLIGYSTGGLIAAVTAAQTQGVAGLVLISATDDGRRAQEAAGSPAAWQLLVRDYGDYPDGEVGCTPSSLATEARHHAASWSFAALAPRLRSFPILIINSNDGYAADSDALGDAIARHGAPAPTRVHMPTDHAYSDHRIALQQAVVDWLQVQFK
jgi:pimeloyl-ACP methyl ester carboxylesterase